jgi:7-cyano-7-deazaguanine synthase
MEFVALKALLFSGGLDSTCLAKIEQPDLLLTVDYGQLQAKGEIEASGRIADGLGLPHKVITAQPSDCGQGLMAGKLHSSNKFPPEWWPFRNQYLLTVAAMHLENGALNEILIGTVSTDSLQSDGSQKFLDLFNDLLLAQRSYISVRAPAIKLTSQRLFEMAKLEAAISGWIFSCHTSHLACGRCRGCSKSSEILARSRAS